MTGLAAWWRYRRRLAALAGDIEGQGYEISPVVYRRLLEQARQPVSRKQKRGPELR